MNAPLLRDQMKTFFALKMKSIDSVPYRVFYLALYKRFSLLLKNYQQHVELFYNLATRLYRTSILRMSAL